MADSMEAGVSDPLLASEGATSGGQAASGPFAAVKNFFSTPPAENGRSWFGLFAVVGACVILAVVALCLSATGGAAPSAGPDEALVLRLRAEDLCKSDFDDKNFRREFEQEAVSGLEASTRLHPVHHSFSYSEDSEKRVASNSPAVLVDIEAEFPRESDGELESVASKLKTKAMDAEGLLGKRMTDKYGRMTLDPDRVKLIPAGGGGGDTPTPAPTTTAPTSSPTPGPEPTMAPTGAPTPGPAGPTEAPTEAPTPGPAGPTEAPTETPTPAPTTPPAPTMAPTAAPTPFPTTVGPTPAPTPAPPPPPPPPPCPFHYVMRWSLMAAPWNLTDYDYNTTLDTVRDVFEQHLGWGLEDDGRIQAYTVTTKMAHLPGCNGTEQVEADYADYDDAEEEEQEASEPVDLNEEDDEKAYEYDDTEGNDLDKKKKKKKKKEKLPMANTTGFKLEVIFDDRADGIKFGGWLIGAGRTRVQKVITEDGELCGSQASSKFSGQWRRLCVGDESEDSESSGSSSSSSSKKHKKHKKDHKDDWDYLMDDRDDVEVFHSLP